MKIFRSATFRFKLLPIISVILLVSADRLTKRLAVLHLTNGNIWRSVNLITIGNTEILNFTYAQNTGASFSILQGQRVFLITVTSIFLIGVLIYLLSNKAHNRLLSCGLTLIIAGGLGNLIDRIFLGYVVDFIYFKVINFPIFNFADICAVTGAFIGMFAVFKEERANAKKKNTPAAEENE